MRPVDATVMHSITSSQYPLLSKNRVRIRTDVHKFGIFRYSKGKYLFVKQRQQSQEYLDTMVGLRNDLDSTKLCDWKELKRKAIDSMQSEKRILVTSGINDPVYKIMEEIKFVIL